VAVGCYDGGGLCCCPCGGHTSQLEIYVSRLKKGIKERNLAVGVVVETLKRSSYKNDFGVDSTKSHDHFGLNPLRHQVHHPHYD
jgi:hypothetical protein